MTKTRTELENQLEPEERLIMQQTLRSMLLALKNTEKKTRKRRLL